MVFIAGLGLAAGACRSAQCAEGIATVEGTCVPEGGNCGPCGDHEYCEASVVPNECLCAPGYEGSPCEFAGLIRNSDFDEVGDTSWFEETVKGAGVNAVAIGVDEGDLGVAILPGSALCDAASLTQIVNMPSYDAAAERHVVEVTYTADVVHGLAIGFGRVWKRLPPTGPNAWASKTSCLGEGAYGEGPGGSEVRIRFSASEQLDECFFAAPAIPEGRIEVTRFDIRPAKDGECLAFGQVRNGEALPEAGGWRFETENSIAGAIVAGVGENGASGARLRREASTSGRATMTTELSVPLPREGEPPALRFWWEGSPQQLFEVELGTQGEPEEPEVVSEDEELDWLEREGRRGRQLATLVGTGAGLRHTYCLPPWTHGNVLDLSFSLTEGDPSKLTQLVIDEVEIITDEGCGNNAELLDPGFDYAPNFWSGTKLGSDSAEVVLVDESGNGRLELAYWGAQIDVGMEMYVLVPNSSESGGPVLTFSSRAPTSLSADVEWILGRNEFPRKEIEPLDEWKENEVCLPPEWSDRWYRVQVRATGTDDSPGDREEVRLDDFSLGTSPNCRRD
jgi:hypothetical protein